MTTIITKNGSGAPAAGQLSQGELAVDLTNKELYTKDSGGNVIKVGAQGGSTGTFTDLTATSSFTSPGIDDNATAVALTVTDSGIVATLTTAAQPNITSVGTLTGFTSTGIDDNATSTAITIDANENVGIGTDTPASLLNIEAPTTGVETQVIIGALSDRGLALGTHNPSTRGDQAAVVAAQDVTGQLHFRTGGNTAANTQMVIDSAGNVGIGTTTPDTKLNLATTGANFCTLKLDAANTVSASYSMRAHDGVLDFRDNNASSTRMTLDSAGNLLVGKTASSAAQPGVEIRSTADVFSSVNNSQNTYHVYDTTAQGFTFYVSATGTINAANTTIASLSDERLKENVRDLDDGLSKVMALQPRKFDWKTGKGRDISDDRGFIAQEFETVFPDMVNNDGLNLDENGESYKTIGANLIPTLVKAMQEQQAMIETLQAEVAALKGA